jgi:tetratricopeptide (TPR) repeat protein
MGRSRAAALAAFLVVAVLGVFWKVGGHDFTRDDASYLIQNPDLVKGLSPAGLRWAFTSTSVANWHPLTWLTHLADYQLFGLAPRWPHLVNAAIHAVNAALIFTALASFTGAFWRSALVALLFAFHPLHVESVAWISERKDLLAGLFFALTLLAYRRYARRPSPRRFVPVVAVFALGLLSKPMLVTVPFLLLILDFWPLGRLDRTTAARLAREKLPLVVLAAASAVTTLVVQYHAGAVHPLESLPIAVRLENAAVSWVAYLGKTLWPVRLAAVYPYRFAGLGAKALVAAPALAAATAGAVLAWRRRPYLAAGWFWYLGMLVPVIGIVQVGVAPYADRYTYLPLLGIFIAVAFALPGAAAPATLRAGMAVASAVAVLLLAARTSAQLDTWKDDLTLLRHAAATIDGNWEANAGVGFILAWNGGDRGEALRYFRESLRQNPGIGMTHLNFGVVLLGWGMADEALQHLAAAAALDPGSARIRVSLGRALEQTGRPAEAAIQYEEALRLDPGRTNLRGVIQRLRAAQAR